MSHYQGKDLIIFQLVSLRNKWAETERLIKDAGRQNSDVLFLKLMNKIHRQLQAIEGREIILIVDKEKRVTHQSQPYRIVRIGEHCFDVENQGELGFKISGEGFSSSIEDNFFTVNHLIDWLSCETWSIIKI